MGRRPGSLLCSRVAHSRFIGSGPRWMERSPDARSWRKPGRHPLNPDKGWMECRVPVAFQIATGDDARSEEQPRHPLLLRLKKGEVREGFNCSASKTVPSIS